LVAYTIGASVLSPGAGEVDLQPNFVIGGDVVGRFGCWTIDQGASIGGQFLAASAGFVYVINLQPNCNSANPAPEIDVYNTNNIAPYSSHTDIAPVAVIPLQNGFPIGLSIGPSGTVTGGQAILRNAKPAAYRRYLHHWPAIVRRKLRHPPYAF
jgi:hypothetical protein